MQEPATVAFTPDEMEEIVLGADLFAGATADGELIIAYDIALRIASEPSAIQSIPRSELLTGYAQFKSAYSLGSHYEWFDTRSLIAILKKLRHLIISERKNRRER